MNQLEINKDQQRFRGLLQKNRIEQSRITNLNKY